MDLPPRNTEDEIAKTLDKLEEAFKLLGAKAGNDAHLLKLVGNYRKTSVSKGQFRVDLKGLDGFPLDFIGMFHDSLDSDNNAIHRIQKEVALMVAVKYNVMWSESFAGGERITFTNSWKVIQEEMLESDHPGIRETASEKEVKQYEQACIPLHAAYMLLSDTNYTGEIWAADYRPVKAIQQHIMSYGIPNPLFDKRFLFTQSEMNLLMRALSDARNLYCLRYIALRGDRTKKNVLVLGAFHTHHVGRVMVNYGATGTLYTPMEQNVPKRR
ncbi:MAG: hypothetical protein Q7R93_05445 [bacterium]|nr:hypothetical protein [bacterium]